MVRKVAMAGLIASLGLLGACSTLGEQDRATLTQASQNAADAKASADRANATAQQALQASQAAQTSAAQANEKADRMFQKSLRK